MGFFYLIDLLDVSFLKGDTIVLVYRTEHSLFSCDVRALPVKAWNYTDEIILRQSSDVSPSVMWQLIWTADNMKKEQFYSLPLSVLSDLLHGGRHKWKVHFIEFFSKTPSTLFGFFLVYTCSV